MEKTFIGIIIGIVLAIVGAILGKRAGDRNAVVSRKDVTDGIIKRKILRGEVEVTHQEAIVKAKAETERVTKQIKEAPNEEIVRMFHDAFDKPFDERGGRSGAPR